MKCGAGASPANDGTSFGIDSSEVAQHPASDAHTSEPLSWHTLGLPVAHAAHRAGAGAGGRLAHSVQQVFQDHGVIVLLVFGGEQQA